MKIEKIVENEILVENKAVYTAESVACDWAGAVMRKLPKNAEKTNALPTDQPTNRPTDQLTNRPTNGPTQ